MPYIQPDRRTHYDRFLSHLAVDGIPTKGDLEYCIFKLMRIYMRDKEAAFTELHNCTYAAQHCSDEFRRRFLDQRERDALSDNGDVI